MVTGDITGLGHTQFGDSNIDQHVFSGAVLGLRNTSAFDITSDSPIVNILDQAGANTPGTINFGGDVGTLNIGQAGTTLFSSGDSFFGAECSNNHHFSGNVYIDCISTDSSATDVLALDGNKIIKRNPLAGGQLAQGFAADRYPTVNNGSSDQSAVVLYNQTGNGISIIACKNDSGDNYVDAFQPHIYFYPDIEGVAGAGAALPQPEAYIFYSNDAGAWGGSGLCMGMASESVTDPGTIGNTSVSVTHKFFQVGCNLYTEAGSGLYLGGQTNPDNNCPIVLNNGQGQVDQVILSKGPGATPEWGYVETSRITDFDFNVRNVSSQAGDPIKTAIVESVSGQYVDLYCVESPDVRFEDVVSIKANGRLKIEQEIDPEFVFVCEQNSIKAVSYTTTEPALCGVKVKENKLIITFSGNIPEEVTVKLSGIRKGSKGVRFTPKTKEQADHNNDFWNQSKL